MYILLIITILRDMNLKDIKVLASEIKVVQYEKNAVVYKQGDPGDNFYIIINGAVEVHN